MIIYRNVRVLSDEPVDDLDKIQKIVLKLKQLLQQGRRIRFIIGECIAETDKNGGKPAFVAHGGSRGRSR